MIRYWILYTVTAVACINYCCSRLCYVWGCKLLSMLNLRADSEWRYFTFSCQCKNCLCFQNWWVSLKFLVTLFDKTGGFFFFWFFFLNLKAKCTFRFEFTAGFNIRTIWNIPQINLIYCDCEEEAGQTMHQTCICSKTDDMSFFGKRNTGSHSPHLYAASIWLSEAYMP